MEHKGTTMLETDRLILRKFRDTDANDMFKNWGSDPNVSKYLSWQTHQSVKDSEDIVSQWNTSCNDKSVYNWAIELKEINEVIGSISIVEFDTKNESCEIGYNISSRYWNNGITTEALKAVIKYLFEEVEVNRICAKHDTNNVASGKVMQKCGMVYEGILREVKIRNNEFYSLAVYSILKGEWNN